MYYPCSENKGADQFRGYPEADLRLCFRICKKPVFSQRGSNKHENVFQYLMTSILKMSFEISLKCLRRESTDSVDIVQSTWYQWTMSMNSGQSLGSSGRLYNVHGQCPLYPGLCILDFVHGVSGQSPWTLSCLPELSGLCPLSQIDIVQTVH